MLLLPLRFLNRGNVNSLKALTTTSLWAERSSKCFHVVSGHCRNNFPRKCNGIDYCAKRGQFQSLLNIFVTSKNLFTTSACLRESDREETSELLLNNLPGDNSGRDEETMKVLHVAEKNDAAKRIAQLLSNGACQTRNGYSVYNKLYQFQYVFRGQRCDMTMTSVSGHMMNCEFDNAHRKWHSCDPVELFDAPVLKNCTENMKDIKKTLEQQAVYHQVLIIWTDCDREGENIGYEVISVCQMANPRLQIYRAKFSEITKQAIENAMGNLGQPDKRVSDAVDVRQELDLRIGAAFTRFQTLRLTRKFPAVLADRLISYGSCQFPTLGFVVERYKAIQDFVSETFWKIDVTHEKDDLPVAFTWHRGRLFDRLAVLTLYEACIDNPTARVIKVQTKPKSKWRPVALDTIEFEKLASRKLKIGAKEAMQIAERLYTSGYISYPRTETNIFPPSLNLAQIVEDQAQSTHWGGFASRILQQPNGPDPRNGKKSDQAHPPIHPAKFHNLQGLNEKEKKVYELIVRHFLACCSKDAKGHETIVEIEIAEEKFIANGLNIKERNYLEVYIYDKWSDKELPEFHQNETFVPKTIAMNDGKTSPPKLLTEADLIALMEKHGIGTDATHAEHIETIKSRQYVGVDGIFFIPGKLGMGLVEGYDAMGFEMSKPFLRAQLESDLQKICEGRRRPEDVLAEQIRKYKQVFIQASDQVIRLDEALARLLNDNNGGAGANPQGGGGGGGTGGGPSRRGPNNGGNRRHGGDDDDDDDDNHGGGRQGPRVAARIPPGAVSSSSSSFGRQPHAAASRAPSRDETIPAAGGVTCSCGLEPDVRTTRREGPNLGRQFYKCDNCGFFLWMDAAPNNENQRTPSGFPTSNSRSMPPPQVPVHSRQPQASTQPSRGGSQRSQNTLAPIQDSSNTEVAMCQCGLPAGAYTVRKEGVNKGRRFFGCATPFGGEGRCDFFKWDDNTPLQLPDPIARSNPRGGAGSSRGRGSGRGGAGGAKRTRRCGICHQEGHTRKKCPLAYEGTDEEEEEMEYT